MRPRIILPACSKLVGVYPSQTVHDKYVDAVAHGAGGFPIVMPCPWLDTSDDLEQLLAEADGIFLTGSPSNIEPRHYAGPALDGTQHDPQRDAVTLPLIRAAVARGIPILGVCRGHQEMNVALGGSLHQRVHEVGFDDHREADGDAAEQYAPAHEIALTPGGRLADIIGKTRTTVNSLHWQGIDRLAPGCHIEATADDGLIEAFSVLDASGFTMAVQWHPEWMWSKNTDSTKLFAAFGDAARAYAASRR